MAFNVCQVCGERMTLEDHTNAAGDHLQRWVCPTGDWVTEWDLTALAPGETDTPHALLLQEAPVAREVTSAMQDLHLRQRLDDLLGRVGPVTPGDSLVEVMRRVLAAVDTLELSSDAISLNADAISLNTDQVEALLDSANTRLGNLSDPDTADTVIGRLKRLITTAAAAETARSASAATAQARLDTLATEAGLTSTRDALDARLEAIRALVDAQPTLTERATLRTYAETLTERRARDGLAYISSSGRLSLTAAGNVRTLMSNPGGSGRNVYVYKFSVTATQGPAFADMRVNPTTGLPAAAMPRTNVLLGGPVPALTFAADVNVTTPLTGGTATGVTLGIFAGRNDVEIPTPLIIPPGNSIGINVPFAGVAECVFTPYWYEEAI